MNDVYRDIIGGSDDDRRGLFLTTSERLGTTIQNIEKDFWVCWTLKALFQGLEAGSPRLLFKGGTSLSKGYDLISRFSEDIDITVFRDDIGAGASADELEELSNNARRKRLDGIKEACQTYINGPLLNALREIAKQTTEMAGQAPEFITVAPDSDARDQQSLLVHYQSVAARDEYIAPFIKIESGAKSCVYRKVDSAGNRLRLA